MKTLPILVLILAACGNSEREGGELGNVRIDTIAGCHDSISISAAIEIAEARIAGGTVIAAIPDDDVTCAREIQVLAPDLLWEVKVAGNGDVLEIEESDETED